MELWSCVAYRCTGWTLGFLPPRPAPKALSTTVGRRRLKTLPLGHWHARPAVACSDGVVVMQTQTLSTNETESQALQGSFDNALTTEKNTGGWTADRRERLRSGFFNGKKLSVVHDGQVYTATVVDSSDRGLGLELAIPLEAETALSFSGVGLQGRAHVRYCRRVGDNVFRVGLHLEAVSFHKPDTPRGATAVDPVNVSEPDGEVDSGAVKESASEGVGGESTEDLVNLANRVEQAPVRAPDAAKSAAFALASIAPRKVGATSEDQVPIENVVTSILSDPAAPPAEASTPEGLEDEAVDSAAQEQRATALDEIVAGWPELGQQIEGLERNVSEQQAQVANTLASLAQTSARSQEVQERQTSNVASVLEFVSAQQAELSTVKTSVSSLSKEVHSLTMQLNLVMQVLFPGDEPKG